MTAVNGMVYELAAIGCCPSLLLVQKMHIAQSLALQQPQGSPVCAAVGCAQNHGPLVISDHRLVDRRSPSMKLVHEIDSPDGILGCWRGALFPFETCLLGAPDPSVGSVV